MFGYVVFLLFVSVLWIFRSFIKRWLRQLHKNLSAYFLNKIIDPLNKLSNDNKEKLFGCLREISCDDRRPLKVLEIGAGCGANFKYLPKNTEIICLEPNDSSRSYLLARAAEFSELKVTFHVGVAENLSFLESESLDAVVCTLVLCSVTDVDQCLKEVLRVLKKDGKFIFLEHILAEDGSRVQFWQYFFRAPWQFLMEGCTMTRSTHVSIQKAGFSNTDDMRIFEGKFEGLKLNRLFKYFFYLFSRHCEGVAVK